MIPTRLEIKNFLPYRTPDPIRFDGVHLACLTGANGAGKSSLLDAITWALWGKARTTRDDDLIHLGQDEMFVQLDFEQEGVHYRVLRRRTAGKRGRSQLDLFVLQDQDMPNLITEPSISLTQKKINTILRMDYDTFIHSAFLQQGKADAFTTLQPAKRKQLLSDILGLEQWAVYEDRVKQRIKEIESSLNLFEGRILEIERDLSRKPQLEKDLQAATVNYQEAEAARLAAEERLKEVEHAPTDLRNAQQQHAAEQARRQDYQRDLEETHARIEHLQQQIQAYQQVIQQRDEIEAGYNALQSARAIDRTLSDKLMQLTSLKDDRAHLQNQIDTIRTRLEGDAQNILQRIQELEAVLAIDHTEELATVQADVADLQAMDAEYDKLNEQINQWKIEWERLKTLDDTLLREGVALKERLEILQASDTAICPTCGQPLHAELRQKVIQDITAEMDDKRTQVKTGRHRMLTLEHDIKEAEKQLKTWALELKRLNPLLEHLGKLQSQADSASEAQIQIEAFKEELQAIQTALEAEDYAHDLRQALAQLDDRQAAIGYDEAKFHETREAITAYEQYDKLNTQLSIALESLPAIQASLQDVTNRAERLKQAILQSDETLAALESDMERLKVLVAEYQQREAEVRAARTTERNASERLTIVRQELKTLQEQADRKIQLEERRESTRVILARYEELKRAFGKNGVPAMVIETAIPELEITANTLLSKMTDGRMSLRLTTQREKVTGGVMETLDIEIADELGTRSYELYSGGEAFRIDFALRVALSQMLARRAGAHLRTLFIDEGFGTQDDDGRAKLTEAIIAIQDVFDMILVITHIDELRDSFPVHIVVDKTPNGSRVMMR
ncbi:MAG: hypothetical protein Kow00117_18150 [Phototrophicales bacterium]